MSDMLTMTLKREHADGASVPETWECIDCGFNTAPGWAPRAAVEVAFNGFGVDGIDQTIGDTSEVYVVRDKVWTAAGLEPEGGCLCIGCLEKRIGRRLKPKDFPRNHVLNWLPGTPRLLNRQCRR